MFIRKAEPEEIEMKEIKPRFNLTQINFVFSSITFDAVRLNPIPVESFALYAPIKLDFASITDELYRTPKITCTNPDTKNETESLMSRILNDIWIEIFPYLDVKTLALMMISCKKMADLANDNGTRERLYRSRENHRFFKLLRPVSTPVESFFDRHSELFRLRDQVQTRQFVPIHQDQQVYNDNPPGQGFVMR